MLLRTRHCCDDWIRTHEAHAEWSFAVATVLQRAACRMAVVNRDDFTAVIQAVIADLPDPGCLADRSDLSRRLLEFSLRVGRTFHERHHRERPAKCGFIPETCCSIWSAAAGEPKRMLTEWLSSYLTSFNLAHPLTAAQRAAKILRDNPTRPLPVDVLARAVGVSESVLKRQFAREYGTSLGEYRSRARLLIGIAALQERDVKVCEAAWRAGYRSTASFNVALKKYLQLTPTEARRTRTSVIP